MEITKFRTEKKQKKEMTCKYCIYLQVEKGYKQTYVNDDRKWKKNVEAISFFCKKKGTYIRRATRYKGCPDKQTVTLEAYT